MNTEEPGTVSQFTITMTSLASQVDRLVIHTAEQDAIIDRRFDNPVPAVGDLLKHLPPPPGA